MLLGLGLGLGLGSGEESLRGRRVGGREGYGAGCLVGWIFGYARWVGVGVVAAFLGLGIVGMEGWIHYCCLLGFSIDLDHLIPSF